MLSTTPIPVDFDVYSIDIDGNDYYAWRALQQYRPKLVVIEFNQTIPSDVVFIQEAKNRLNWGNSLLAITQLGTEKGYSLIATTTCNSFSVRTDLLTF